jgi:hypothetical protein
MTDVLRQEIENLSKNFEKIYIINSKILSFLIKIKIMREKNYKINIPNNCILSNPKTLKNLMNFN